MDIDQDLFLLLSQHGSTAFKNPKHLVLGTLEAIMQEPPLEMNGHKNTEDNFLVDSGFHKLSLYCKEERSMQGAYPDQLTKEARESLAWHEGGFSNIHHFYLPLKWVQQ